MRKVLVSAVAGLLLSTLFVPATAQQASPGCAPGSAPLAAEMAGWCARAPLVSASSADGLTAAVIEVGRGYDATLKSTADVRYVVRPEKPGGSVSYGGLFAFNVAKAGTYRVALSTGAWIDLLKGGKAVVSTAHGRGPDGSGVRKMVDFPLAPGRYTLQIAANGEPGLGLMIAQLP